MPRMLVCCNYKSDYDGYKIYKYLYLNSHVSLLPHMHNSYQTDPAGRAGGALTSTLLKVLYADERTPEDDLSFTEVLTSVREHLKDGRYTQIPQLSSMNPIDLETKFDLVPDTATGVKRAVMIGINYVGEK